MARRQEKSLDTPRGRVKLRARVSPEEIDALEMDQGMGMYTPPYSPPSLEKKALKRISREKDADIIVAVDPERRIVGFIAIGRPAEPDRWGKLGEKGLLEALAIEVSADWRCMGIANAMMRVGLEDPAFDQRIVMCTGFSWHWDMDGVGISKEDYRRVLLGYLAKAGFQYFQTDDPNVQLDPANFLTARVGRAVSPELLEAFADMLFSGEVGEELRRPRSIAEVLAAEVRGKAGTV